MADFVPTFFTTTKEGVEFTYTDRYGAPRTVRTGETWLFEDPNQPCAALDFLNASQQNGVGTKGDPSTVSAVEAARRMCASAPGGDADVTPPPTPAPVADPSTTGTDEAAPAGDENGDTLGAPSPITDMGGT